MSGTTSNMFSIGKDVQCVMVGPTGTLELPKITGFHSTPKYETAKSKVLDGPTRQFDLPDGHDVSVKFDRTDNGVDSFFSALEAAYWAIGGFVPTFTLYQYINERDGSTSTYEYTEFTCQYMPGDYKSGSAVAAEIKGFARFKKSI